MILPMIASIFLIIAIVCFLNLTPQQITKDLSSVVSKKPNIRDRARALRAGKKKTGPGAKLEYLQSALKACGKEGMFAFVCSSALGSASIFSALAKEASALATSISSAHSKVVERTFTLPSVTATIPPMQAAILE